MAIGSTALVNLLVILAIGSVLGIVFNRYAQSLAGAARFYDPQRLDQRSGGHCRRLYRLSHRCHHWDCCHRP